MYHQRRLSLILIYVKMSHYKTSVRAVSAQKSIKEYAKSRPDKI
jgi:hypothetical protein